jgi:hypothetical protein|nr:MAG TPA: hypothetical protein [Caudoviricetes sp.]
MLKAYPNFKGVVGEFTRTIAWKKCFKNFVFSKDGDEYGLIFVYKDNNAIDYVDRLNGEE